MAETELYLFYRLFATHLGIFYLLRSIFCWVERGKEGRHQSLSRSKSGVGHSLEDKAVLGEGSREQDNVPSGQSKPEERILAPWVLLLEEGAAQA